MLFVKCKLSFCVFEVSKRQLARVQSVESVTSS